MYYSTVIDLEMAVGMTYVVHCVMVTSVICDVIMTGVFTLAYITWYDDHTGECSSKYMKHVIPDKLHNSRIRLG